MLSGSIRTMLWPYTHGAWQRTGLGKTRNRRPILIARWQSIRISRANFRGLQWEEAAMPTVLKLGTMMALVWIAAPAVAQSDDPDFFECEYGTDDEQIAGCSALIQSGRLATADLAAAFYFRAEGYFSQAYFSQGDYARAIADYSEAIRLDPQFVEAINGRGFAYRNQKDYARAIADFSELIRLNPQREYGFYDRGLSYKGKKDYARAITDFSEVIRLNPQWADAFYHRGYAYFSTKDYVRATADFTEANRLYPNYALALYGQSLAKAALGQSVESKADRK